MIQKTHYFQTRNSTDHIFPVCINSKGFILFFVIYNEKNVKIETKKANTSNLLKTFSIFIQNVSISDPRPDPTCHATNKQ